MFFFSVIGAIQMRYDDDDDDEVIFLNRIYKVTEARWTMWTALESVFVYHTFTHWFSLTAWQHLFSKSVSVFWIGQCESQYFNPVHWHKLLNVNNIVLMHSYEFERVFFVSYYCIVLLTFIHKR